MRMWRRKTRTDQEIMIDLMTYLGISRTTEKFDRTQSLAVSIEKMTITTDFTTFAKTYHKKTNYKHKVKGTIKLNDATKNIPLHFGDGFHAWVEDKDGRIVFDPYFLEYDVSRSWHKLRGNQRYRHWSKTDQAKQMKTIYERSQACIDYILERGWLEEQYW